MRYIVHVDIHVLHVQHKLNLLYTFSRVIYKYSWNAARRHAHSMIWLVMYMQRFKFV